MEVEIYWKIGISFRKCPYLGTRLEIFDKTYQYNVIITYVYFSIFPILKKNNQYFKQISLEYQSTVRSMTCWNGNSLDIKNLIFIFNNNVHSVTSCNLNSLEKKENFFFQQWCDTYYRLQFTATLQEATHFKSYFS